MHSVDKASPSISLNGCGHLVKMLMLKSDIYVMKTSTCFKGSYSLIVSYSRTISNYFETKSYIYSLLITVGLIYLDKKNCLMIAYFALLVGVHCSHMMINRTLEHKHHNLLMISLLLIVNALYPNVALGFPHFS